MSRLIAAVTLSSTRVRVAVASIFHASAPPQWKLCTESVVPKAVDPLLVLERLLSALGDDVDVLLIDQPEARSLLLQRYAQDTIVLVQPPHAKSRALWTPLAPKEWAPLLMAHWRVADLVYTYTRRLHQAAVLDDVPRSAEAFFDRFRYRASGDDVPHAWALFAT
jgi:hypothetical protein